MKGKVKNNNFYSLIKYMDITIHFKTKAVKIGGKYNIALIFAQTNKNDLEINDLVVLDQSFNTKEEANEFINGKIRF